MSSENNSDWEIARLVSQDFELEVNPFETAEAVLHRKLSFAIAHLLQTDFQKLLRIFYRIDVNEQLFRQALASEDSRFIPDELAQLVIDREKQKVFFRRKYSAGN